jgi:UDP-N-acetylglucosamine acyltransferase
MSVSIHPSAIIEAGAVMGDGCEIQAGAIIGKNAVLGERVMVYPYAVVGGDPQHLKFDRATQSGVRIGSGTVIREHVTINRAAQSGGDTIVGERCFLMANSHIGHDCALADDVVLANNVMLAGHVHVGAFTFIGGGAGVHQFARIGESVMVSGLSRISRDLAPFTITAERDEVSGLNLVGLKRRGFSSEAIGELKKAFRAVYFGAGNIRELAAAQLAGGGYATGEVRRFLEFFAGGKRGFARAARVATEETND